MVSSPESHRITTSNSQEALQKEDLPRRRLYVQPSLLQPGNLALPEAQAHHIRHVLRLQVGDKVCVFDGQGRFSIAPITAYQQKTCVLWIEQIDQQPKAPRSLAMAVAMPKGDRAAWLVEKLAEIGVAQLTWLHCQRSVLAPKASVNKHQRFEQLAIAAATQSGHHWLMRVCDPVPYEQFVQTAQASCKLTAMPNKQPLLSICQQKSANLTSIVCLIGPEGGLTPEELHMSEQAGFVAVQLNTAILRVETAAIVAASLLLAPL